MSRLMKMKRKRKMKKRRRKMKMMKGKIDTMVCSEMRKISQT